MRAVERSIILFLKEAAVLLFAILFAALAVLGCLVGFGSVGHPIGDQALNSYGWSLCINCAALAAFFVFLRYQRLHPPQR